jgi:hypothetical protein
MGITVDTAAAQANLVRMLAVWNETDLSRVRARLEAIMVPEVEFIDPTIVTRGLDQFEANVREFRAKYPGGVITQASGFDSHHHLHRYSWAIHVDGKLLVIGHDVTETDEAGKVRRVLGFFGPLPKLKAD